ncbi:SUMF1/EgtB/PvdO family nonheme iron enzyme [Luteolibacter sp. LG18]|uniref:formylglycine-generating enzyme family protein n=1 Tax=Luteolibacter sp. LG18 TaxID=2819286 RepID=UPI002B2AB1D0|nr:hypothetical protein llg_16650 [Luteolibacter sp. LG18]
MKTQPILTRLASVAACSAFGLLTQCAPTSSGSGSGNPSTASVASPFVNSIGMKFVPVPGTKVLMCTTETSVAQYQLAGRGYPAPFYNQGYNHPAANLKWDDAKAWCDWMSAKEGRKYRLPTSAEWNAAAGGSTYPWGEEWPPATASGLYNYCGQEWRDASPADLAHLKDLWKSNAGKGTKGLITGFKDPYLYTAPVDSGTTNGLGLHNLGGNVWEWCESRALRGGSWADNDKVYVNQRAIVTSPLYDFDNGFRCVIEN